MHFLLQTFALLVVTAGLLAIPPLPKEDEE
jgi:hypothetical protein